MQLAMIGLGRMGGNMVERLMRDGHQLVVFDRSAEAVAKYAEARRHRRDRTCADVVSRCRRRAIVWIMVPAGEPVDEHHRRATPPLCRRATSSSTAATRTSTTRSGARQELAETKIEFIDSGTSGGIWGLENGYCLMVGGTDEAVQALRADLHERSRRRTATRTSARPGAGHYVKMVHNGIEYGMLQALRRGLRDPACVEGSSRSSTSRRSPRCGSTAASCARGSTSSPISAFEKDATLDAIKG